MATATQPYNPSSERPIGRWQWLRTLIVGGIVWIAGLALLAATGDPNLIPFVVLWGSFLVPVCAVLFFFSHLADRVLSRDTVLSAFVWGGTIGVLLAVAFEYFLLGDGPLQYVGVGLIEEGAKIAAVWFIARKLGRYTSHDGLVLGAAVGFGFGAMESSGYALVSMFTQNGLSLGNLIDTEIIRGLLAPLGHGLWTGILGAVLFEASSPAGRLRLTRKVVGAYLLVALLHTLWDSMHGIALVVTVAFTGVTLVQRRDLSMGLPLTPSPAQVQLFTGIEFMGMAIISIVGLAILVHMWRKRDPFTPTEVVGLAA